MRKFISLNELISIKVKILLILRSILKYSQNHYENIKNSKYFLIICILSSIFFLLIIVLPVVMHLEHNSQVKFDTIQSSYKIISEQHSKPSNRLNKLDHSAMLQLQSQLHQIKNMTNQQYYQLRKQVQVLATDMNSLASRHNIIQLQQMMGHPSQILLSKIHHIQKTVQELVKKTNKKIWVNPKIVEQYFHLIAVQGFSDGMRAIIEVDGNQMTLGKNEISPACRGWVLKKMSFPEQSATFSKVTNKRVLYAKLRVT